jgi:lysine-specific histone demethylase 1
MSGDHCLLPGGNFRIVTSLADGVPIFQGCVVTRIEHGPGGVVVRCTESEPEGSAGAAAAAAAAGAGVSNDGDGEVKPRAPRERVFRCDAALLTLPLGVLKRGAVAFEPPLPRRKRAAIEALGFGTLNKCVMLFAEPFWDTSIDTFGSVAVNTVARGEFFLFYSYVGLCGAAGATLIGLVAGEAASTFEADDPAAGLERCLATLRGIFGHRGIIVPAPVTWRCTRWEGDPFAYGSYSHVAVGASGDDYDAMAEPVANRLFFAGEATTKKHPATMHGAFFTGLREAARITSSVTARRGGAKRAAAAAAAAAANAAAAAAPASPGSIVQRARDAAAEAAAAALALARDTAHLHTQLAAAFSCPAWEFGSFALAVHPTDASPDAPTLLRVDVGGGGVKRALHVYMCLRLADAFALRDCPGGDAERVTLLITLTGAALFGRRALPPEARALAAELAVRHGVPRVRPPEPEKTEEEEGEDGEVREEREEDGGGDSPVALSKVEEEHVAAVACMAEPLAAEQPTQD